MTDQVREQVRERYAAAALAVAATGKDALSVVDAAQCCSPGAQPDAESCCASDVEVGPAFGSSLYSDEEQGELPAEAVAASLGCGNPMAVADLRVGERVLDLGSGGGIDVLLSARRVGPTGFAYGVDMTDEMLSLARANTAKAGATNVEFLKGTIEDVPLPDASVDVVISNCVINLSTDKPAVLAEMFRVLCPGGRLGISDVVAEDHLTPQMRAERGSYVGCIAGALSRSEYLDGLAAAGFTDAEVIFTHEAAPGLHSSIVKAVKPGGADAGAVADAVGAESAGCCAPAAQTDCCEPSAKQTCCSGDHPAGTCGCQPPASTGQAVPAEIEAKPARAVVEVFEPALCCNTGVCGDDVDQSLVSFSADSDWANAQGATVLRHNLANDPLAFAQTDSVRQFLQLSGSAGLPLVLVDGVTVLTGAYPDRGQLARWSGARADAQPDTVPAGVQTLGLAESGCCTPASGDGSGCC